MEHGSHVALVLSALAACTVTSPPASAPPLRDPAVGLAQAPPPSVSATPADPGTTTSSSRPMHLTAKPLPLPGASGPASLDYIACDRSRSRIWVPVGATGSVDVLDIATGIFTRIDGFKTVEREARGRRRTVGPSAATVGDGFVYIGNRATNEVCPIDVNTLRTAKCLKLAAGTDGVAYVASAKEVWVTTPDDRTLMVLDASNPSVLARKTAVKLDGEPEGYAVDDRTGRFFTNLEDKGGTVVVDVRTREVKATWNPGCDADGPRGIAFDAAHDFVIVACTDHVQVLDAAHDGARLGQLDAGAGVDNIDYVDGKLYVAAGKASKLTVASVDEKGRLTVVAVGETSEGARNAVADAKGNAYVADSPGARLLVLSGAPVAP
jgi:DNA-binding beta-propeller fold protein YncE